MDQQNEQKDVAEKWNKFCQMEEENSTKELKIMKEKEKMITMKRKMMDEITKGMVEKDGEISKLKKENQALKEKMTTMKAFYIKEVNYFL